MAVYALFDLIGFGAVVVVGATFTLIYDVFWESFIGRLD